MNLVSKKVTTLRRIVKNGGVAGVRTVLKEKQENLGHQLYAAKLAPEVFSAIGRYGRPQMFIAFGGGIGDDLLCTVMFRELRQRNQDKLWTMSRNPQLFHYNEDIKVVLPHDEKYYHLMKWLKVRIVNPWYTNYNPLNDRDDPFPEQHIISVMCQKAGILGPITLKPYFFLHPTEKDQGQVVPQQIAIQSSGVTARHSMVNKDWLLVGYQSVISSLKSKYNFVQIGSPNDPRLEGAIDLRGKTTLRQTGAIISRSLVFVGQVGFLMHLARAVDCRSVIIYGGRELPSQSGYSCNENLYSPVSCSPCWKLNTCDYDRECMKRISAEDVVKAVETQVEKYGDPLTSDIDTITQEQIDRTAQRYAAAVRFNESALSLIYSKN